MAEEVAKQVRVERSYYADGMLQEEIHYRGVSEHGPWRRWHPNGQLAGEWWLERGVYMNCTNRTWYPDGALESETTYVNGKVTASRSFSAKGKPLPTLADRQRKALRALFVKARIAKQRRARPMDERMAAQTRAFVEDRLRSRTEIARHWLCGDPDTSDRTLGEFDHELSVELIDGLHSLGVVEALAVEIEDIPGEDGQTTNHLVLRLPEALEERSRVFAFCNAYARSLGFDPEFDHGQQYLYLMLC
jgi:hypothetical protein